MHKNLYLLMEIADREFEGKLLTAFHAVQEKWKVIICPRIYFFNNIKKFPEGVVIYKSIMPGDKQIIEGLKKYGHRVLCIDEEGIVKRKKAFNIDISYGEECLKLIDKLFILDEEQKTIIKDHFNVDDDKIPVTGYPRLEFLKCLKESTDNQIVTKLLKKYNKFIFLPTSFAFSNHIQGRYGIQSSFTNSFSNSQNGSRQTKNKLSPEQEIFFNNLVDLAEFMQDKYEKLIEAISEAFPEITIVLRPHPSEDSNYWKNKYSKNKNIVVDYQYPAVYYIKASELIIQYGSTISIEANILGKPCLQLNPKMPANLEPVVIKENQQYVLLLDTIEDVVNKVEEIVINGRRGITGTDYTIRDGSAELLASIINESYSANNPKKNVSFIPWFSSFDYKRQLRYALLWFVAQTGMINLLPQSLLTGKFEQLKKENKLFHSNVYQYLRRKNGKVSTDRVHESINMFQKKWPGLNKKIIVRKKAFNAFEFDLSEK